jgi:glutaredoxin
MSDNPIKTIVVYHGNGCNACHEEMEFLAANDIRFTAKNVHNDSEARKELIALGSKTIPTTVIDNQVIIGFEVERIKELVGL